MLVLQCKAGEVIRIGSSVSLKIISNKKGQLRLAIDAPDHVKIKRDNDGTSKIQDVS